MESSGTHTGNTQLPTTNTANTQLPTPNTENTQLPTQNASREGILLREFNVYDNKGYENTPQKDHPSTNSVHKIEVAPSTLSQTLEKNDQDDKFQEELLCQEDFEDLSEDEDPNILAKITGRVQGTLTNSWMENESKLKIVSIVFLTVIYFIYFGWSSHCSFKTEDDVRLAWMTCVVVVLIIVHYVSRFWGDAIWKGLKPARKFFKQYWHIIKWILITLAIAFCLFYIIYFVALKEPYNLVSLSGIVILVTFGYIVSYSPRHIKWRPILWGLFLQFIFAILILRTTAGFEVFRFLGNRVSEFLDHTDAGVKFLFGDLYYNHYVAFKVLPIIVFFSSIISVLYYIGIIQVLIQKFAWLMQNTLGTTAGESFNAAANTFIGMAESTLLIRPILGKMTNSEFHAMLTSGFSTIAGSVMAAYIASGVSAPHLISASIMSAPAALAMSKLIYPETKKSRTTAKHVHILPESPYKNVVEAISGGASDSIIMVSSIAANLIAFLALLQFVNSTLTWFGDRACMGRPLTFQLICSYVLYPLAMVMGVDLHDCGKVATLIGVKIFLNEFIAYDQLSKLLKNHAIYNSFNATIANKTFIGDDIFMQEGQRNATLINGFLSDRSEVIATYALCGFAHFGGVGIMLSAVGALLPHRKRDLSKIVIRALTAGNTACFMTACISGLLYDAQGQRL